MKTIAELVEEVMDGVRLRGVRLAPEEAEAVEAAVRRMLQDERSGGEGGIFGLTMP